MSIADREDGDGATHQGAGRERLTETASQAGETRNKPDQRERADPGGARPRLQPAKVETALDPDQQPARERGRDAQGLPVPGRVQRAGSLRRSACQRRWSAMKVEMK
jgi:hypothetical protein